MLAKLVGDIPPGAFYEPKFDGFRAVVFRDGDDVELGSRNERPLTRYFPEIVEAVKRELPERCVVDGEIIIATSDGLDFDSLQLRLHPAESRVRKLAGGIPASFVAFDLLALDDANLCAEPFTKRRDLLEQRLAGVGAATYEFLANIHRLESTVLLTPQTGDATEARRWFDVFAKKWWAT